MNIVVLAWRHWSAGRRFRSLLLNAPKAGHQVYGIVGDHLGDMQMTLDVMRELNITAFPQGQSVEALHPDVIFGEYYAKAVALEHPIHEWANSRGVPDIILDHHVCYPGSCMPRPGHWKHPVFVSANEMQRQLVSNQQEGWPPEQCVVLGSPGADTYLEPVDVAAVKSRLGIGDQPVVGIFADHNSYPVQILDQARASGWWVGIHAHPQERRQSNTDHAWGFYYSGGHHFHTDAKNRGAHFLVDYLPGTICNVPMELCTSHELLHIADVVLTSSVDIIAEGYLIGKKVHTLAYPLGPPADWLHTVGNELVDADYETETPNLKKILDGLQMPQTLQPILAKKWITYHDRNWWARALELAEKL